MRQTQQDTTARRFSSPNFDCEMPADARTELLLRPKRLRILVPPTPPPAPPEPKRPGWMRHPRAAAAVGLCALLLTVALVAMRIPTVHHEAPVVQPEPVPTAAPAPAASWEVPAPRAMLVPVPVRRATLFRLPGQELGVYKWCQLPPAWGGGTVSARYMGTIERFSQIPPNPVPGDLWNITETGNSWIFCTPIGYDHAAWIDP
jgi:hypothetical protein